jgi:hypothetical protein
MAMGNTACDAPITYLLNSSLAGNAPALPHRVNEKKTILLSRLYF